VAQVLRRHPIQVAHSSDALPIRLRDWQQEALDIWQSSDRGVVAVVTGGGKTWFALACVKNLLARRHDVTVVIVVPTLALLDQWVVVLTDDMNVPRNDVAMYGSGHRPRQPAKYNVVVLNTARVIAPQIAATRSTFLIVDECHRAASPHNARALSGTHVATLGLSATPERDFDDLFAQAVVPALGPVIYRYDYSRALADKVIAPFELTNIRIPLTKDEQAKYNSLTRRLVPLFRKREKGVGGAEEHLYRLLRDRARVSASAESRIPAAIRILNMHKRVRALVFHEHIAAADAIAQILAKQGHRVAVYHSGVGSHVRQDNLRRFRRGQIDTLVTCRALDEGINVPDASLAVIVASTSSTRQRIQRLGRVLRPAPGKAHAQIFTIYASEPEADRLRVEEEGLEGAEAVRWRAFAGSR
jgi:superfamily II DNA or RNA helicase